MNRQNIEFGKINGEDIENIFIIPYEDIKDVDISEQGIVTNIQIDNGSSGFTPFKFDLDYDKISSNEIIIDTKLNILLLLINFKEKKIFSDEKWSLYNLEEIIEIFQNSDPQKYPKYREKYCLNIENKNNGWIFKIEPASPIPSIYNNKQDEKDKRNFTINKSISITVKDFSQKYKK